MVESFLVSPVQQRSGSDQYVKDQARIDAARIKLRAALAKPHDPDDCGADVPDVLPWPTCPEDGVVLMGATRRCEE